MTQCNFLSLSFSFFLSSFTELILALFFVSSSRQSEWVEVVLSKPARQAEGSTQREEERGRRRAKWM
jgi:hypothetical protein